MFTTTRAVHNIPWLLALEDQHDIKLILADRPLKLHRLEQMVREVIDRTAAAGMLFEPPGANSGMMQQTAEGQSSSLGL